MGKSLNGKELGKGLSQRKDGLYQGRFVNRFGKKQTVYAKTLNEVRQKLRNEQYEDEKALNVVAKDVTLDEWYEIWMDTCKKNCRDSTKETYAGHYRRIQKALGWRKLTSLNLLIMQQAINELETDNERKNSKKILVDMLEKAIDTGMRIGELMGLQWSDVDFEKKVVHVRRSLCYFRKDGKYVFEWHDTKTHNSKRTIPLTTRAMEALKKQRVRGQEILLKNAQTAQDEYKNLVFVTRNNRPTQQFIVQECMDVTTRRIQKEHPEFERFSPHCFRHTFATRAIENGMQPKSVQKLLGHGSLQLTMDLYCHVTDDTLFDEMRKMEAV